MRALILSFAILLLPAAGFAESGPEYVAGTHYVELSPPLRTRGSDGIEVTEFFWYGCGACFSFEPLIKGWKKTAPDDVTFVASPAIWNPGMALHARAYFTAQAMGMLDVMHDAIFTAMHVDRKRLNSPDQVKSLFLSKGADAEAFDKVFSSFGVDSQVKQAQSRALSAKISGTPEMMVAGKYRVSSQMTGGQAQMLKVVDFLVAKERAAL